MEDKNVQLRIYFGSEDEYEDVTISMQEYLNIQYLAQINEISFEEQFNQLLEDVINDFEGTDEDKNQ